MRFWFLLFIEVIFVGLEIIKFVRGNDCPYNQREDTILYGFSYRCSSFSLDVDDKFRDVMPSGEQVSFKVTMYYLECSGNKCLQTHKACDHACPCCTPYMGADPGYQPIIWAPNNEASRYMQNLNCILPKYLPIYTGLYNFSCSFNGYGMANTSKLVQMQLFWKTKAPTFGPYSWGVYIIAGTMSLPDCIWQWERGNKFPLNEYGVFRILLYDGYGNKISAATGGTDRSIVAIDVMFFKYKTNANDSSSGYWLDVHTTWKLTYQIQYGFCIITVYCSSVGKYQIKIIDEKQRSLGNTPTYFYVTADEAWTGTRFIPPPAPRTYFLGDNSKEKARAGVTAFIANTGAGRAPITMNLLLTMSLLLSIIYTLN